MAGEAARAKSVRVPPAGLVARLSTDVSAIEDPEVSAAVRFIREHACDGIGIDDVLRHVPLSRSTLGRRFRRSLGRTVRDEILRVRLRRAQELLAETDLSIEAVTDKSGFAYRQYFGEVFKAKFGETPATYRKRLRG
jgi:LacI family transcriptional regulator